MLANSIEQVIIKLDEIIEEGKQQQSPLGYFPALYKKVTERVRDGIQHKHFDDNERMERLDVVFANRYLEAYYSFKSGNACTKSWQLAFEASHQRKYIVIQHLFLGMNAHINLDLGLAAAQVAPGDQLASLEGDFMKINALLASLVNGVQDELGQIWPMMKFLDKLAGKLDEKLADFSMSVARDGAWRVAKEAAGMTANDLQHYVAEKDKKVNRFGLILTEPGWRLSLLVLLIRLTEKGSVARKIAILE